MRDIERWMSEWVNKRVNEWILQDGIENKRCQCEITTRTRQIRVLFLTSHEWSDAKYNKSGKLSNKIRTDSPHRISSLIDLFSEVAGAVRYRLQFTRTRLPRTRVTRPLEPDDAVGIAARKTLHYLSSTARQCDYGKGMSRQSGGKNGTYISLAVVWVISCARYLYYLGY